MQRVYANQFHIHVGDEDPMELLLAVAGDVKAWVQDSHRSHFGSDLAWPRARSVVNEETGTRVSVDFAQADGAATVDITYEHDDPKEEGRQWRSRVRLGWMTSLIEVHVEIFTGFALRLLRREESRVGQPRLVRTLVSKYPCFAGATRIEEGFGTIGVNYAPRFVREVLMDPTRRIPVVVLAPIDLGRRRYITPPNVLSSRLLGIAHVYCIRDAHAGKALQDELEHLSLPPNSARVYWPGFSLEDEGRAHPLYSEQWFRDRGVESPSERRGVVESEIYEVASQCLVRGETSRLAEKAVRGAELEKAKQSSSVPELREQIDMQESHIRGLEHENEQLRQQVRVLQSSLARGGTQTPARESVDLYELGERAESMAHLVELVQPHLPGLVFETDVAKGLKKARKGPNDRNVGEVVTALRVLNDLAGDFHSEAYGPRSLGKPLDDWIRERALVYGQQIPKITNHESESTKGMYGDERNFTLNGRKHPYERHATTLEGRPECLQIYWEYGDDEPVIHVGYIGPHLSYSRSNT